MSVTTTNRETVRDEIATLLTTGLVGNGLPAQAVYGYQAGDFKGQSPVVLVLSAGDDFTRRTAGERVKGNVYLEIWNYIAYADRAAGWTEANAEDRLDLLKKSELDILFDNQFTHERMVFVESRSTVARVKLGGKQYLWETFPVRVQVFNG